MTGGGTLGIGGGTADVERKKPAAVSLKCVREDAEIRFVIVVMGSKYDRGRNRSKATLKLVTEAKYFQGMELKPQSADHGDQSHKGRWSQNFGRLESE
ncbi:hypothetical protein Tcan_17979 [Toxocara canis]|uniref:Uncharacterized protein n=1 Tax=Toxocara canis TaxID=6265 RepID=A0A0B2US37_TOXCA|nr:hypothetical protein Tcan_17979 [Toxocara canis]